jgi:hypothetical protein
VINEVFVLSPERFYSYSWMELFNPTATRMMWASRDSIAPTRFLTTRLFMKLRAQRTHVFGPSSGVTDTGLVYLTPVFITANLGDPIVEPGGFAVLTSDSARFREHSNLGPGTGAFINLPYAVMPDSLIMIFNGIRFFQEYLLFGYKLLTSSELQLVRRIDTLVMHPDTTISFHPLREEVLDVVRYGDYRSELPNSFPSNFSAGMIPEWYSLARFSVAYSTGNTRDDFYMEPAPTPLWHNQRAK